MAVVVENDNMAKPLVSVIIPVYNQEKYLPKCLDSVLMQAYPHWEAIVVDDGSTDGSAAIIADYAARDSRVRVFRQENSGQAAARNFALRQMRGDYVMFIDSDDWWLSPTMMGELVERAEREHWDIIIFGAVQIRSLGRRKKSERLVESDSRERIFADLLAYKRYPALWNKFYAAWLWRDIQFREHMESEDFYIQPELFYKAKRIVSWNKIWYAYNRLVRVSSTRSVAKSTAGTLIGWERSLAMVRQGKWPATAATYREMRQQAAKMALRLLLVLDKGETVAPEDKARAERLLAEHGECLTRWRYRWQYFLYRCRHKQ